MSRTGMRMVVARAIVDKQWRKQAFGAGADIKKAIKDAGYDVNDLELNLLSCNNEDSFDEKLVTIDTWEHFWKLSEERFEAALTGRKEAGPIGGVLEGI